MNIQDLDKYYTDMRLRKVAAGLHPLVAAEVTTRQRAEDEANGVFGKAEKPAAPQKPVEHQKPAETEKTPAIPKTAKAPAAKKAPKAPAK